MDKKKLLGYIFLILGLLALAISLKIIPITIPESIKPAYVMIIAIVLIILGVVFSINKKAKQESEVPIYEVKGKKRRIVGYRRMK